MIPAIPNTLSLALTNSKGETMVLAYGYEGETLSPSEVSTIIYELCGKLGEETSKKPGFIDWSELDEK